MARPLIEYIYAQCLPWQTGLAPLGIRRELSAKVLSYDPDLCESSLIVRYPAGWAKTKPEALSAEEEMYVLDGEITINGRTYARESYACFPAGYVRQHASSPKGCVATTFFDGIPEATTAAVKDGAVAADYINLYDLKWETGTDPTLAWMGNRSKTLRYDPVYQQKSTFVFSTAPQVYPVNWECPTLTHPCVEESFHLAGSIAGPHGIKRPGGYFWRPPGVAHGPFGSRDGTMSLIRFRHGKHVNVWDKTPVKYSFDMPYKPALPPELVPLAKDYMGGERY